MNFAVIENQIVVNLINAETQKIAESVTGLTCVEYSDSDLPYIGLGYVDGEFEQPLCEELDVPTDTE